MVTYFAIVQSALVQALCIFLLVLSSTTYECYLIWNMFLRNVHTYMLNMSHWLLILETVKASSAVLLSWLFLGHLSQSGDLLLWVGVRRRASSVVRRTSSVVR